MDEKSVPIGDAVSFGWETMKNNVGFFVLVILIMWVAAAIPSFFQSGYGYWPGAVAATLSIIFALVGLVVATFVHMAQVKISLGFCDQKPGDYNDLYNEYPKWLNMLGGMVLYFLIVLAGLILLIIPGIYWAVRYNFFGYLIIDKNMGPVNAIKRSGEITRGVWWELFVFFLAMMGIYIIGFLLCCVGLLFAIPIIMVAMAYVFRTLDAKTLTTSVQPVQPPPSSATPAE